jgi:hypothetical protein
MAKRTRRHFLKYVLCNARDHQYGRCNQPIGHDRGSRWHAEMRRGRLWASWRGPVPGERCGICGTDHRLPVGKERRRVR